MNYTNKVLELYKRQEAIDTVAKIVKPKMYKVALPEGKFAQEQLPDIFQTKWSKFKVSILSNIKFCCPL